MTRQPPTRRVASPSAAFALLGRGRWEGDDESDGSHREGGGAGSRTRSCERTHCAIGASAGGPRGRRRSPRKQAGRPPSRMVRGVPARDLGHRRRLPRRQRAGVDEPGLRGHARIHGGGAERPAGPRAVCARVSLRGRREPAPHQRERAPRLGIASHWQGRDVIPGAHPLHRRDGRIGPSALPDRLRPGPHRAQASRGGVAGEQCPPVGGRGSQFSGHRRQQSSSIRSLRTSA